MSAFSKYGQWTPEDAEKERQVQQEKKGSESAFLTIKPDTSVVVRVIPSREPGGSPFMKYWKHSYRDKASGKFISYPCPSRNSQQDCPDCRRAASMISSGIEAEKTVGYGMRAKPRILVNLLVRPSQEEIDRARDNGDPDPVGKNKIWDTSSWVGDSSTFKSKHEELLDLLKNTRRGGDFINPGPEGLDLMISRSGEGMSTRYEIDVMNREDERKPLLPTAEAVDKLVEEDSYDLRKFTTPPTADQLVLILQGEAGPPSGGPKAASPSATRALPPRQSRATRTAGDLVDSDYGESSSDDDVTF